MIRDRASKVEKRFVGMCKLCTPRICEKKQYFTYSTKTTIMMGGNRGQGLVEVYEPDVAGMCKLCTPRICEKKPTTGTSSPAVTVPLVTISKTVSPTIFSSVPSTPPSKSPPPSSSSVLSTSSSKFLSTSSLRVPSTTSLKTSTNSSPMDSASVEVIAYGGTGGDTLSNRNNPDTGKIAGGVVGALVLVGILSVIGLYFLRKRRANARAKKSTVNNAGYKSEDRDKADVKTSTGVNDPKKVLNYDKIDINWMDDRVYTIPDSDSSLQTFDVHSLEVCQAKKNKVSNEHDTYNHLELMTIEPSLPLDENIGSKDGEYSHLGNEIASHLEKEAPYFILEEKDKGNDPNFNAGAKSGKQDAVYFVLEETGAETASPAFINVQVYEQAENVPSVASGDGSYGVCGDG